jgi:hypothetical protein
MDKNNSDDALVFKVVLDKGDKGFGIYFTTNAESHVLVEGFVPCVDDHNMAGPAELLGCIHLNDVLQQINGVDITDWSVSEVIDELRMLPRGPNTLTFRRPKPIIVHQNDNDDNQNDDDDDNNAVIAITQPSEATLLSRMDLLGVIKKAATRKKQSHAPESSREETTTTSMMTVVATPEWWREFNQLKTTYAVEWEMARYTHQVSEIEFCLQVYHERQRNLEERASLRTQYPILFASVLENHAPSSMKVCL